MYTVTRIGPNTWTVGPYRYMTWAATDSRTAVIKLHNIVRASHECAAVTKLHNMVNAANAANDADDDDDAVVVKPVIWTILTECGAWSYLTHTAIDTQAIDTTDTPAAVIKLHNIVRRSHGDHDAVVSFKDSNVYLATSSGNPIHSKYILIKGNKHESFEMHERKYFGTGRVQRTLYAYKVSPRNRQVADMADLFRAAREAFDLPDCKMKFAYFVKCVVEQYELSDSSCLADLLDRMIHNIVVGPNPEAAREEQTSLWKYRMDRLEQMDHTARNKLLVEENNRARRREESKQQRALEHRVRERLMILMARERAKTKADQKKAAKAKRAEYEAEVAMIQQMAEVEAVKQMSEAEEQARTQKLLAMPEKDKCERKKCRVMRGVHQDILQREGCSRCLAGKCCRKDACKKIFQTDISPEEKAKRAARLRSDSSDSCSTEEALAEEMD